MNTSSRKAFFAARRQADHGARQRGRLPSPLVTCDAIRSKSGRTRLVWPDIEEGHNDHASGEARRNDGSGADDQNTHSGFSPRSPPGKAIARPQPLPSHALDAAEHGRQPACGPVRLQESLLTFPKITQARQADRSPDDANSHACDDCEKSLPTPAASYS